MTPAFVYLLLIAMAGLLTNGIKIGASVNDTDAPAAAIISALLFAIMAFISLGALANLHG